MAIFYIDSLAHYTTAAQGSQKAAAVEAAPSAGSGAFGAPAELGFYIHNYTAIGTLEISIYGKSAAGGNTWFDIGTGGINHVRIGVLSDGTVRATRVDYAGFSESGTVLGSSSAAAWQFNVHHHILCRVVISDTVGSVFIKIDGNTVLNLTGLDTRSNGGSFGVPAAETTQFRFYSANSFSHLALASASGDIPGQPRVQAVFATADGAHTAWTPVGTGADHKDRIKETTPDDTNYNKSATVGQKDSYQYANALASTTRILAVQFVPRAAKTDAAVHEIRSFYRTGGVDYAFTTKQVPASAAYLPDCRPINPATGVEFTVAEVNAPLEAGVEVVT
jgi:hypothetical protein